MIAQGGNRRALTKQLQKTWNNYKKDKNNLKINSDSQDLGLLNVSYPTSCVQKVAQRHKDTYKKCVITIILVADPGSLEHSEWSFPWI